MRTRFQVLWKKVDVTTTGMTHLGFNQQGLIILHQDYWDSAGGFYARLPILGGVINAVRSRIGEASE